MRGKIILLKKIEIQRYVVRVTREKKIPEARKDLIKTMINKIEQKNNWENESETRKSKLREKDSNEQ